jgi:gamma-glutamylaminecyclotransferase
MSRTTLFVYGTLKRGLSAHHYLADQIFLGEAHTVALYRLYRISWHPGLVEDPEGVEVQGELWSVDDACLAQLDRYEDVPDLFVRRDIAIAHHFEPVQAYFYNHPLPPGAIAGDRWPLPE